MPNDLTAAEQAAAEALAPTIGGEYDPHEIAEMARAVVAAVRPLIEAETLEQAKERLNDQADRVRAKFGSQPRGHNRTYGLHEAASMLASDAKRLRAAERQAEGDENA